MSQIRIAFVTFGPRPMSGGYQTAVRFARLGVSQARWVGFHQIPWC